MTVLMQELGIWLVTTIIMASGGAVTFGLVFGLAYLFDDVLARYS